MAAKWLLESDTTGLSEEARIRKVMNVGVVLRGVEEAMFEEFWKVVSWVGMVCLCLVCIGV